MVQKYSPILRLVCFLIFQNANYSTFLRSWFLTFLRWIILISLWSLKNTVVFLFFFPPETNELEQRWIKIDPDASSTVCPPPVSFLPREFRCWPCWLAVVRKASSLLPDGCTSGRLVQDGSPWTSEFNG